MAPVASGVADREQDRLVVRSRPPERLLAPRVPVDGVVRVLEEVRARLPGEAVHLPSLPSRGTPAWFNPADVAAERDGDLCLHRRRGLDAAAPPAPRPVRRGRRSAAAPRPR